MDSDHLSHASFRMHGLKKWIFWTLRMSATHDNHTIDEIHPTPSTNWLTTKCSAGSPTKLPPNSTRSSSSRTPFFVLRCTVSPKCLCWEGGTLMKSQPGTDAPSARLFYMFFVALFFTVFDCVKQLQLLRLFLASVDA